MLRIFVAFSLPENLSTQLKEYLSKLNPLHGIRFTRPENLHITLFFIGEVDESIIPEIISRLNNLFSETKPFTISFEEVKLAGKKKRSSMIWAQFQINSLFSNLSNRIHEVVKEFMHESSHYNDPIPHITLARISAGVPLLNYQLPKLKIAKELHISNAELWQSVQTKEGVIYKSLAGFRYSE